jgi:hypothetical protein
MSSNDLGGGLLSISLGNPEMSSWESMLVFTLSGVSFVHGFHQGIIGFGSESESSDSDSSSSDSDSGDDAAVQQQMMDFPAHMSGFGGYKTYMRDTPDRFETEADDTLMKSMYKTYATEGEDKNGLPTGHFWVTKADAEKAASEVVGTHL